MDEHYILNVLKALGQKIDTLEWQLKCSEEERMRLMQQINEMEVNQ